MLDNYWNELLPIALECGMTPTQFWEDEPRLVHSYLRKHELVLEEQNYQSWLIGLYVYDAMSVVMANSFGKGKKLNYMEKPVEINPPKQKTEEDISTFRQKTNYWAKFKNHKKKGG